MDSEYFKRFYAVQFTTIKENRKDLTREQQIELALENTQNKYYVVLEELVLQEAFYIALSTLIEFKAFLEEAINE